eukprot:m51a1_g13433 hypothetical protein (404) ;mRNA; f:158-1624
MPPAAARGPVSATVFVALRGTSDEAKWVVKSVPAANFIDVNGDNGDGAGAPGRNRRHPELTDSDKAEIRRLAQRNKNLRGLRHAHLLRLCCADCVSLIGGVRLPFDAPQQGEQGAEPSGPTGPAVPSGGAASAAKTPAALERASEQDKDQAADTDTADQATDKEDEVTSKADNGTAGGDVPAPAVPPSPAPTRARRTGRILREFTLSASSLIRAMLSTAQKLEAGDDGAPAEPSLAAGGSIARRKRAAREMDAAPSDDESQITLRRHKKPRGYRSSGPGRSETECKAEFLGLSDISGREVSGWTHADVCRLLRNKYCSADSAIRLDQTVNFLERHPEMDLSGRALIDIRNDGQLMMMIARCADRSGEELPQGMVLQFQEFFRICSILKAVAVASALGQSLPPK